MAKRAVVCGAGGFIASHLVKKLKREGYWVRGVDVKRPEFADTAADEFLLLDLREAEACRLAVAADGGNREGAGGNGPQERRATAAPVAPIDEVYNLAADMGGMGFIHSAECEIMRNSALVNLNMVHAAASAGVPRYFFSSSVCIYRDMAPGEPPMHEAEAYPALPDNEYGWEKLYAERTALAYGRRYGMQVRIARFQNCYGPEGTWRGGREKAPAAISRKVAEAADGGTIEVWGDGEQERQFIYVDDLVEAIYLLMHSDIAEPANIGNPECTTINGLVDLVADVAGKRIEKKHVEGPVGVRSRNFANDRIYTTGWRPRTSLREGMTTTYRWVEEQVKKGSAVPA
jgi:GDP-D-mannose 3',5'-epimerase